MQAFISGFNPIAVTKQTQPFSELGKRKYSLIFLVVFTFLLSITNGIFAQCPANDLVLKTQADVDAFLINYPNCTELDVNILIAAVPSSQASQRIENMTAFDHVERMNGTLSIDGPLQVTVGDLGYFYKLGPAFPKLKYLHELYIQESFSPNVYGLFDGFAELKEIDILELKACRVNSLPDNGEPIKINESFINDDSTNGSNLQSFGSIELTNTMDKVVIESTDCPSGEFSILDDLNFVNVLHFKKNTGLTAVDQEIYVENELAIVGNSFLESIDGISVDDQLQVLNLSLNIWADPINLERLKTLRRINQYLGLYGTTDISFVNDIYFIGNLDIDGNDELINMDDFVALDSVGNLSINYLSGMDDLSIFSDVTFFGKYLEVISNSITSLNGLSFANENMTSIEIAYNENLNDLSALSSLKETYDLIFLKNEVLDNLNGLENLTRVNRDLKLEDLPALVNLEGLTNLEFIDIIKFDRCGLTELKGLDNLYEIGRSIDIKENPSLVNFDGLVNVKYLSINSPGYIRLQDNPSLASIEGLNDVLGSIEQSLTIVDNPLLDNCSIDFLCSSLSYDNVSTTISGNGLDCNSEEDVIDKCGFNYLEVFLDLNRNAVQELNEPNIGIGQVLVGDQISLYPNENGRVQFFLTANPSYIEYVVDPIWEVTTNNAYTDTPDLASIPDLIKVGIVGVEDLVDTETYMSFTPMICDNSYTVMASVKNNGTVPVDVNLSFTAPGAFQPAYPNPDAYSNDTIFYFFGEMLPGVTLSRLVTFVAPNVIDAQPGDILDFSYETEVTDLNDVTVVNEGTYNTIFLCAYDPNDKQVFPIGDTEDFNISPEETEHEYLIRFQNTGNYPAQNITIRDTIDSNLDMATFEFIHASHEVSQIRREGNALAFVFNNIFLPDSISNEPASHGFVQFKINRKDDLPLGTVIENTAHIYFESNPAIVTNTVFNTLYVEPPSSTFDEQEDFLISFSLAPNPTSDQVVIFSDQELKDADWHIMNAQGKLLKSGLVNGDRTSIDVSSLSDGIYFVKVKSSIQKLVIH